MFTLFLDRTHRVLLTRFTGTFTLEAIADCDRVVLLILGREGPVRGIIDLTEVAAVDIPADGLRQRAQQPPIMAGQERVFVAQSAAAIAFTEAFTAYHRAFGSPGVRTVRTLAEAHRLLGLTNPTFEPLPVP